jgi:hypothetical protein
LHHYAVSYFDATGLCDLNDFASGFVTEVLAGATMDEPFILRTHRNGMDFDDDDIASGTRIRFVDYATFLITKHCCNFHISFAQTPDT